MHVFDVAADGFWGSRLERAYDIRSWKLNNRSLITSVTVASKYIATHAVSEVGPQLCCHLSFLPPTFLHHMHQRGHGPHLQHAPVDLIAKVAQVYPLT